MDFGIFNLMGYRTRGTTTREVLEDAAALTRLADDGGIAISWFAEHHFSNYGICPSPLTMAAYCAPQTKRIKLATGIVVLPLYSPVRLAAEIAMVDTLSQGRLIVGIGTGYQPYEFERFGADLAGSKDTFEQYMHVLEKGLTEEFVEHDGLGLPATHIAARTHDGKLPEFWVAGHAPQVHRYAAERGYPMIVNGRFYSIPEVAAQRPMLEGVLRNAGRDPRELKWGVLRYCCVTDDPAEALEYAENARWQLRVASSLRRREEVQAGIMMLGDSPFPQEQTLEQIVASQMIGNVETCIQRGVEEIRRTGVNHISLYFQLGDYPHKKAMRSLERFIGEVIPGIEKELGPLSAYPPANWQPLPEDRPQSLNSAAA